MGSLIYQNVSRLSESNIIGLLFQTQQSPSLLRQIRDLIETELAQVLASSDNMDESFDLIKKLDLISVQLIYNLTIPTTISNVRSFKDFIIPIK